MDNKIEEIDKLERIIRKKFPMLPINIEWDIARLIINEGYRKILEDELTVDARKTGDT